MFAIFFPEHHRQSPEVLKSKLVASGLECLYQDGASVIGRVPRDPQANIQYLPTETPHTFFLKEGQVFNFSPLQATDFERYGLALADKIRGQCQWLAWDKTRRTLCISQTLSCPRHVYYYRDHSGLCYLATRMPLLKKILQQSTSQALTLNLKRITDLLTLSESLDDAGYYQGVFVLKSSDILQWAQGQFSKEVYWHAEAVKPLNWAHREAYYEAFREKFAGVISPMLSLGGIASDLSGGLDSSSVSAMAARLLLKEGRRLDALGAVPSEELDLPERKNWNADDRVLMKAMAHHAPNIDLHWILEKDFDLTHVKLARFCVEQGDGPVRNPLNMGWFTGRYDFCKRHHRALLLSGASGNLTISWKGQPSGYYLQMRARAGQLYRWLKQLGAPNQHWYQDYSLVNPHAVKQFGVKAPLHTGPFWQASHAYGVDLTLKLWAQLGGAVSALDGVHDCISYDPTASREMIEFALSVPSWVYTHQGWNRVLIREGMGDLLPDMIRWNKTRGEQHPGWFWELKASQSYYLERLKYWKQQEQVGQLIDLDRVEKTLHALSHIDPYQIDPSQLIYDYRLKLGRALHIADWIALHDER